MSSNTQTRGKRRAAPTETPSSVGPVTRRLTAIASVLIMMATAVGGGAVYALNNLDKNIHTVDESDLNGSASPSPYIPSDTSATNFLVMGSDTRAGQGAGFGNVGGARSDTALLVHLYEGRTKALVVSIPRDSFVSIGPCKQSDGGIVGPWETKFNAAFAYGGPVCTIKTLRKQTGIAIDKFIVIDFKAFKSVVDTLGGVKVCLTTPVYDPYVPGQGGSGLNLPAGYSTISGKQALAFVRARESIGDGSDLGRITRQQEFLSSMIRGMQEKHLLTNPTLMYRLLNVVTESLTTSQNLSSMKALEDFALSLANLKPSNITFVTTPYRLIGDGNVHWTSETDDLWKAIRNDEPWPPVSPSASASPSASDSVNPTASASPSPTESTPALITPADSVNVIVLNGTSTSGLANKAASQLRKLGYHITRTGNADAKVTATEVHYNSRFKAGAESLAYSGHTAILKKDNSLTKSVVIVVGPDWTKPRKVVVATPSASSDTGAVNAGDFSCTEGNNRIKTK